MGWGTNLSRFAGRQVGSALNLISSTSRAPVSAGRTIGGSLFGISRTVINRDKNFSGWGLNFGSSSPTIQQQLPQLGSMPSNTGSGVGYQTFLPAGAASGAGAIIDMIGIGYDIWKNAGSNVPATTGGNVPAGQMPPVIQAYPIPPQGKRGTLVFPEDIGSIDAMQKAGLLIFARDLVKKFAAPHRGYVVVHPITSSGQRMTIALRKDVAKYYGLWHPGHKPPISVGQWQAVKKAHQAKKTLAKVNKMYNHLAPKAHRHAALPAPKRKK